MTDFQGIKKNMVQQLLPFFNQNERECNNLCHFILQELIPNFYEKKRLNNVLIDTQTAQKIDSVIAQLQQQKPIQYIFNKAYFYDLALFVNENTLIPRPETEELVYYILQNFKHNSLKMNILDIGTGSGCIALALKKNMPTQANLYAIDISPNALQVAQKNANTLQLPINFYEMDILNPKNWQAFENEQFNIIVSNPPYISFAEKNTLPHNVLHYEPHTALFETEYLEFYKAIADFSKQKLKNQGFVYVEINENNAINTKKIFCDFQNVQIIQDMQQKPRILVAQKN